MSQTLVPLSRDQIIAHYVSQLGKAQGADRGPDFPVVPYVCAFFGDLFAEDTGSSQPYDEARHEDPLPEYPFLAVKALVSGLLPANPENGEDVESLWDNIDYFDGPIGYWAAVVQDAKHQPQPESLADLEIWLREDPLVRAPLLARFIWFNSQFNQIEVHDTEYVMDIYAENYGQILGTPPMSAAESAADVPENLHEVAIDIYELACLD